LKYTKPLATGDYRLKVVALAEKRISSDELVHESVKNSPFYAQASMVGASHFTPSEEPQKLARVVKGMLG
jgi:hypothetical protein